MTPAASRLGGALILPSAALVVALGGCSSGHQDIQQWMNQQRQAATPRIVPVAKPVPFVAVAYTQSAAPGPFETERLTDVLKAQNAGSDALLQKELNRRKEPLEAVPLDAMSMVGSLGKNGPQVALIKANNLIYQIRVGNYLGQNYGRVTRITESGIDLREIIQDSSGEWIEHNATMQLQESQEKSR